MSTRNWSVVALAALSLVACGESRVVEDGGVDSDGAVTADGALPVDGAVGLDGAVGTDAGGELACTSYPMQIAGTVDSDALASSPARCGMPAYEWLRGDAAAEMGVGTFSDLDAGESYPGILLGALAQTYTAGVTDLPFGRHDIGYRVIRYITQDRGVPVEASALVAYPEGWERGDIDMLLLLHGTSGFTDGCGTSTEDGWVALSGLIASLGYVVVAPDYIGLKTRGLEPTGFTHPYLGGEATAIASIDALRATLSLRPEVRGNTCPTNRVVALGGSQGGHAALWVERLLPYYGREFDLLGTVATVPPAAIYEQAQRALTEYVDATANTVGMLAALSEWYGVRERLDEVLVSPLDVDIPTAIDSGCSFDEDLAVPETLEGIFTESLLTAASSGELSALEPWGCMITESDLFRTSVNPLPSDVPLLLVTGADDQLVHTPIERESYDRFCNVLGVPAQYLECEGAGHTEGTTWSLPEILDWAIARFDGDPLGETCAAPTTVRCRGTQD